MPKWASWILGFAGLAGGIALTVAALLAVAAGAQVQAVLAAAMALGSFLLAAACNRQIQGARVAASARLAAPPRPIPVPAGEMVLRMRWLGWALALALFGGLSAGAFLGAAASWRAGHLLAPWCWGALAVVLAAYACSLLDMARRVLANGGVAHLDVQGFRHALLPALAWKHVRGIDLREQRVKSQSAFSLVLAIDPAVGPGLVPPAWQRALSLASPRLDEAGRLLVPLAYVRGEPQQLAGMALSVADRWGAPRIADWKWFERPAQAAQRREAAARVEQAQHGVQRMLAQAKDRSADPGRLAAETERALRQYADALDAQVQAARAGVDA